MYLWLTCASLAVGLAALASGAAAAEGPTAPGAERGRQGPSVDLRHGDLAVSPDGRFLVHKDGTPFFYLGDTAWELLHRLDREQTARYLENRRAKGFTVIQAVGLAELDGLGHPNAYGQVPLVGRDPARPNEEYFKHVDYVVDKAGEKGIYIGMLPTWGSHVVEGKGVFNVDNARAYGLFLGRRYKDRPNIIWVLGGDRDPKGREAVWRAMAAGLAEGDGGRHLMTFHPGGGQSSSALLHAEKWLAFNMCQSGHGSKDNPNDRMVEADYARKPVKPCMDGEPRYEDHPVAWRSDRGWFDDYDVRQAAYWALLAGAHGHTYGCHPIWMMWDAAPKRRQPSPVRHTWQEVLDLSGAWDMMHVRDLMESRPMLDRAPDQGLIASDPGSGRDHARAARGKDYAMIYLPTGRTVEVNMGRIAGRTVKAWWFDPRTGKAQPIGELPNTGRQRFDPPGEPARGNDWLLVLDDAGRGYGPPGAR